MSFQMAVTVVSSFTVISASGAYSVSPIFQPANSLFVGAVNLLADKVYFEPFVSSAPSILPEPPFASYFTVTLMSFHVAIRVTSPEILSIFSPAFLSPS